jgi:hypothetical protein
MVTAAALTVGGLVALVCFFRSELGTLNVSRILKNVIAAAVMSGVLWGLTKLLYHPDMKCGMNAAECEAVIRNLYY